MMDRIMSGLMGRFVSGITLVVAMMAVSSAQAQYTNLHSFTGGTTDGKNPFGALILDGTTLYGTAYGAGASNRGTVFKISADGSGYTNLHSFAGAPTDNAGPEGSLVLSAGMLYGLGNYGGTNGNGSVFRVNTDGSGSTNLHTFVGGTNDGKWPQDGASLILDGTMLYGMTTSGGAINSGVVFRVNTDGSGCTNLHGFMGGINDGRSPYGSLTLDGSTLYGMTRDGGTVNSGVVFSVSTDGSGYTNLHSFMGGANDGASPYASLTLDGSTLYGMTRNGGTVNSGVVFSVNTDGSGYTNLHSFAGGANDGAWPQYGCSLLLSGTTLYGMTTAGGVSNRGVVFAMNQDGSRYANLHSFVGGANDGTSPCGSPILFGTTLYGMTRNGGISNSGVVFALLNVVPNAVSPSAGTGASADPYKISVLGNLVWMGDNVGSSAGMYYTLQNDIDASATLIWDSGAGFRPIGTNTDARFNGVFDGNGKVISNLSVQRPSQDYVGLFGFVGSGGVVKNLGLAGVALTGSNFVGGLVGYTYGPVSNCYATGQVTGNDYVGGLVGYSNYGPVSDCYAAGAVTGSNFVGGLLGENFGGTASGVSGCYATGPVTGNSTVGGLLGMNDCGSVRDCYSRGPVTGNSTVGGLVGYTYGLGVVVNRCYATGPVTGSSTVGGLVGVNSFGTVDASYWDTNTTGQATSAGGGTGTNTAAMMQRATFIGWDFANVWRIRENSTYPLLRYFSTSTSLPWLNLLLGQ